MSDAQRLSKADVDDIYFHDGKDTSRDASCFFHEDVARAFGLVLNQTFL